jgi:hypothetical protein
MFNDDVESPGVGYSFKNIGKTHAIIKKLSNQIIVGAEFPQPATYTIRETMPDNLVGDSKEAVSVGISTVSSPDFLSLRTSAVSRADLWPPVSASKNSVPGS